MSSTSNPVSATNRRGFLQVGITSAGAALAGVAAQANTLTPPTAASGRANSKGRFADKVVLITGATSGIGEGTAKAFAMEGAKVFFNGRREALGKQVEAAIRASGGEATYFKSDVRVEFQVQEFVDACIAKYGRIDIAFNNAGTFPKPAPLHQLDSSAFDDAIKTNTYGTFFSLKHEIPRMLKQGGGVIVNMASVSGHAAFPGSSPYGASKHGVLGLTKFAAIEYADKNIRVNSLSPLAVDTPMLRQSFKDQGLTYEQVAPSFPNKRIMNVEEMARAVMFLASDDATSLVGMDLDVTGGYLAK